MPLQLLNDPAVRPTDAIILGHLGKVAPLWQALFGRLGEVCPAAEKQWRYYKDGKSWLLKVTKKSRTLCWISIGDGTFRMTCYFPVRAQSVIEKSDLPGDLKDQFAGGRSFGNIRAITIWFRRKADVKDACALLAFKDGFR